MNDESLVLFFWLHQGLIHYSRIQDTGYITQCIKSGCDGTADSRDDVDILPLKEVDSFTHLSHTLRRDQG